MWKKISGILILYLSLISYFKLFFLSIFHLYVFGIIFAIYLMKKRDIKELLKEKLLGVNLLMFIIEIVKAISKEGFSKKEMYLYLLNIFLVLIFVEILKKWIVEEKRSGFIASQKVLGKEVLERYGFTEREKEVIEHLIMGKTYKELASDLFVSQNTIKKHISNIYVKAKVNNKSELMYLVLTENID